MRNYVWLSCIIVVAAGLCAACGTSPVEENVPYMILSNDESVCFDVPGGQTNRGVQIILWGASDPSNAKINQTWYFRKVPDGYKIFSQHSTLCLNVAGASPANDAIIIQWTDSGEEAEHEIWEISGDDSDGYTITSKMSKKLISAENGSARNGVYLVQYEENQQWADAQTWKFKKLQ